MRQPTSRGPRALWLSAGLALAACGSPGKVPLDPAAEQAAEQEGALPADIPADSQRPNADSTPASEPASAPAATAASRPADQALEKGFEPVHGQLSTRYRGRWTGGAHDQDVYERVDVNVRVRPDAPLAWHVLALANGDLDGKGGSSELHSLDDIDAGALTGRLYHAYADVHAFAPLQQLRLGRQVLYDTPAVAWFDGASLLSRSLGAFELELGAYAGAPVHLYQGSADADSLLGAFAQARPWSGGRARLDWMHAADPDLTGVQGDDLLALSVWQQAGQRLALEASHSRLEGDARDLRAAAYWSDAGSALSLRAAYYELLQSQKQLAVPLDPFLDTLFELFPYRQYELAGSKSFGERLDLAGGASVRRVSDAQDVGDFNRDFERYHLTATLGLPRSSERSLALTGEVWDGGGSDIRTLGLDLRQELGQGWVASLGSYYALFKYDLDLGTEAIDARTWYLDLRWKRSARATWSLRYEYEDSDVDAFQILKAGLTWRY